MEHNPYTSSSFDDEPSDSNLLGTLSRSTQVLFQNNANSSNIRTRNTIHIDRIEVEILLIRQYFANDSTFANEQFRIRFHMSKGLFMHLVGKELSIFSNNMGCEKLDKL